MERAMVLTSWMHSDGGRVQGWQCNDCGSRHELDEGSQAHLAWHEEQEKEQAAAFKAELEAAIEAAKNEGLQIGVEQGLVLAFEVVEGLDASEGVVQALALIADTIDTERARK